MNVFLTPFQGLLDVEELKDRLKKHKKPEYLQLSGVTDAGKALVSFALSYDAPVRLLVTSDEQRARDLYEEMLAFDPATYYFPGKDLLFFQSDVRGNALTIPRVTAMDAILSGQKMTLVTSAGALMNRLPEADVFRQGIRSISLEDELDLEEFRKFLIRDGYEALPMVEEKGQFSVRGGIIDVFPLNLDHPVRIELFGDEVDSIKLFEVGSQRSTENLESVRILPAVEFVLSDKEQNQGLQKMRKDLDRLYQNFREQMQTEAAYQLKRTTEEAIERIESGWSRQEIETYLPYFFPNAGCLLDYLPKDCLVLLDEGRRLRENVDEIEREFQDSMKHRLMKGNLLPGQMELLISVNQLLFRLQTFSGIVLSTLDVAGRIVSVAEQYHIDMQQGTSYNGSFELLLKELAIYRQRKERVLLVTQSRTRGKRLAQDLMEHDVRTFYSDSYDKEIQPGEVMVTYGQISRGFEFPASGFVIIAETDIFGQHRKKRKKKQKKYEGESISGFRDLTPGDYVVHENHGLGIYRGIEKIEVDGVLKDYIKIEYAKGSVLYVLATQLDSIQKYGGADGKKPRLNTLGGQEWSKTKAKVQSAVGVIAKDLVDLYAVRQEDKGYQYGPDTEWQKEFEESFPYEETDSQLSAIEDVKRDMESPKIMDRLICGDVGYGKTEIAMRAAFKAVQENKQVVYLAPTTILCDQIYNNFVQRMKDYPVTIAELSRFRSETQQKETIKRLKQGLVDIVIGTHRALSNDVKFKDLGLLIIDEEQRFGVRHKEKIKQMKKNVDVLSLSATPIPRTLHMSLVGIRDMSVLEEAPIDRQPIQTFVFEYNEEMIREAIARELSRDGQVYFVTNRVRNIADVAARIQELLPDATVAYAHGQMNKSDLEEIMARFLNQEIDILVATTIIEIGLDIPNVNTIIISDADRMGLSQLYQLRGRVGRSSRTAYAFFLYKKDKILKEDAEKRLSAIREFTDLGSGFKIAMRDLEIRGAGNMLGKEQHGHMEAVGYDLYCKMLNEAVKKEKGEAVEEDFDTTVEIDLDAYIPTGYISAEMQRLDIYKRIASIRTEEDALEIYDELIDRYGEPGRSVENLIEIAKLRAHARRAYISEMRQTKDMLRIVLYKKAKLNVAKLPLVEEKFGPYVRFVMAGKNGPEFDYYYQMDSRIRKRQPLDLLREFADGLYELAVDGASTSVE